MSKLAPKYIADKACRRNLSSQTSDFWTDATRVEKAVGEEKKSEEEEEEEEEDEGSTDRTGQGGNLQYTDRRKFGS